MTSLGTKFVMCVVAQNCQRFVTVRIFPILHYVILGGLESDQVGELL